MYQTQKIACFLCRTFLLVGYWLCCACLVVAQEGADSSTRPLPNMPVDTQRVNRLVDEVWDTYENDLEAAVLKLTEAGMMARQLNYKKGEGAVENAWGAVEEARGDLNKAEAHYRRSLALRREAGDLSEIGATLNNLGVIEEMSGRFDSALVYHRENKRIQEQRHDSLRIARALFNMAGAYQEMGLYDEAHQHLQDARLILEARNDLDGAAKIYTQMGHIRLELDLYAEAREYYAKALHLREQLDAPGRLAEALTDYANALDELDSSKVAIAYYQRALQLLRQLKDRPGQATVLLNLGDANKKLGNYTQALQYLREAEQIFRNQENTQQLMETHNVIGDVYYRSGDQAKALEYTQKYFQVAQKIGDQKYIQGAYKDFAEVYAAMGDYVKAYDYRVKFDELSRKLLNEKMSGQFAQKEALYDDQKKQEQIEQQRRELRVQEAELARRDAEIDKSRTLRNALIGGALALVLLVGLLFNRNRIRAKANRELEARNRAVARERERADTLLKNILPEATAEELKLHNTVQPVRYESVTVMFSDFVNFTQTAEKLSPEALIATLDEFFRLFDDIIEKNGLEKIKTIGDAYMCAGGLPLVNETHPFNAVQAAIEMQEALKVLKAQREASGQPFFEMRVGIHTGPVVAGVVGSRKFAYDIWGDTVNTAARLEQGSTSGKINISETTYQLVKIRFKCVFRGYLPAKNKGEIAMYFVES